MAGHRKRDRVAKFIESAGKGTSYLGDDEVADLSGGDAEDLATMLDRQGIDLSRDGELPSQRRTRSVSELEAGVDDEIPRRSVPVVVQRED